MNYDKLRSEWKTRIDDYNQSGLTKSQWCREKGLKLHQLHYWIKRFNSNPNEKENQSEEINWVPVTVNHQIVNMNDNKSITIKFEKCDIEVNPGFDKEHLKDIVQVLSVNPHII
jgi:hypothetical protein